MDKKISLFPLYSLYLSPLLSLELTFQIINDTVLILDCSNISHLRFVENVSASNILKFSEIWSRSTKIWVKKKERKYQSEN